MPAKKHNFTITEIKAGMMVIASIAVFGGFALAIAGLWPEPKQVTYVAYFSDIMGLNENADVRFGGVKVGRIRSITTDAEHSVPTTTDPNADVDVDAETPPETAEIVHAPIIRVEAAVDPGTPINERSIVYIGQTTLTAEKHLEITTGLPQTQRLAAGAEIPVGGGGGLFDQAGSIASSIESGIESLKAVIGVEQAILESDDGRLDTTLVTLLRGVDQTVRESKGLVGDARDIMGQYRGDIGTVINEVIKIEQSAAALVEELNSVVTENRPGIEDSIQLIPILMTRVNTLADDLERIAAGLQRTVDTANATIVDNRPAIEETILDLRDTVSNLKNFSRNLSEQPESVLWGKSAKERK